MKRSAGRSRRIRRAAVALQCVAVACLLDAGAASALDGISPIVDCISPTANAGTFSVCYGYANSGVQASSRLAT